MNETARNIVKENFQISILLNSDESKKNRCNPNIVDVSGALFILRIKRGRKRCQQYSSYND